ncbi:pyruvate dehydrogenase [Aureococcus anophagefferens]|nr:pyruvate dehydrogenase [Aureococcus anophagefferens]
MAQGAFELRARVGERGAAGAAFEDDASIHGFLDSFYTSRIGIRMIIGQYVALRSPVDDRPDSRVVGLFNTAVNPAVIAEDAVRQATALCERQFGVAPAVKIIGRTDLDFEYVPDHVFYILLELLKNSMRASCEKQLALDADEPADIKVIVADGEDNEDVALKISDEGGGIARSDLRRVWSYLYTTASADVQARGFNNDGTDFVGAPLAGLGYGLPSPGPTRASAATTLMSMEGLHDGVRLTLRLGDHDEPALSLVDPPRWLAVKAGARYTMKTAMERHPQLYQKIFEGLPSKIATKPKGDAFGDRARDVKTYLAADVDALLYWDLFVDLPFEIARRPKIGNQGACDVKTYAAADVDALAAARATKRARVQEPEPPQEPEPEPEEEPEECPVCF